MTESHELMFESPSFIKRLKGMLGVDFYRLFHTPMFYIFLVIAAVIPAMILGTTGTETTESVTSMYTNTWQIIAADTPLYVVSNMGEYANMNMVFIFGGIMVSIFIGHNYKSGYVKQLFTTHAKKQDYMMSKTITCAFAMACMCITYTLGGVVAGLLTGTLFEINVGSLILAIVSKMIMSLGWASLYTFLNIIFRRYCGKSTTEKLICGLLVPSGGTIKLFGRDYSDVDVRAKVGVLIESPGCFQNYSVWNNMILQANNLNIPNSEEEVRKVLKMVRMEDSASNKYKNCSLGMKQRIGIAMALLGNPTLLVLDEPINGLDADGMRIMREILVDITKKLPMYYCDIISYFGRTRKDSNSLWHS